MQTANELKRLLDDLLRRNGMVSEGGIADKVGEFIKQWYERAHASHHSTEIGHTSRRPCVSAAGTVRGKPRSRYHRGLHRVTRACLFYEEEEGKAA